MKYKITGELDTLYIYDVDLDKIGDMWVVTIYEHTVCKGQFAHKNRYDAIKYIVDRTMMYMPRIILTKVGEGRSYTIDYQLHIDRAIIPWLMMHYTVVYNENGSRLETRWFDDELQAKIEAARWIM